LEREQENLRAALRWGVGRGDSERALRLGGALWLFWFTRGRLTEGREWLEELLALAGGEADRVARSRALAGAATLARYQGDYAAARPLAEQALVIHRELANRQGIADALDTLGYLALYGEDFPAARALYEEALAIHRQLDNAQGIADSLSHLGLLAHYQHDHATASRLHSNSLALWRELGDRFGIAWALSNLGLVAYRGDLNQADSLLRESVEINDSLASTWGIACSLEGLAILAAKRGQAERALRLAGAAAALRIKAGTPLPPAGHTALQRVLQAVSQQVGLERALAVEAEGQRFAPEEAIRVALAAEPFSRAPRSSVSLDTDTPSTPSLLLSPREREVALLVARGLTNREIADALVIGERTVDTHVEHIRNKLGVRTRLEIAARVGDPY
jgi:non-specific serine/threonine protein kinase